MAKRPYEVVSTAVQPLGKMIGMDEPLDALRGRKSGRELGLLREACRVLSATRRAFEGAVRNGAGAQAAALAAKRAGYASGAQDVRILASARNGGSPQPLEPATNIRVAPLLACLAARFAGYWAEGLVTISATNGGAQARAESALSAMLRVAQPGASAADLSRAATAHLRPYRPHPWLGSALGNGVGLSLEEAPILGRDPRSKLGEGGVYTLRCGALGEGSDSAVVSALVALSQTTSDVLWSGANSASG